MLQDNIMEDLKVYFPFLALRLPAAINTPGKSNKKTSSNEHA